MPQQNERRTDPTTGESRIWNGARWESSDVQPLSPNEPDTYMGGFVKGGLQSLGESKGRLAALGGLLGSFVGAPNVGAMAGTEVGNLAEKAGGGNNTLAGDAARVATVGATGWGLGKLFQGGQYLADKMGAGNAALNVASHLPIVGKYARLAQALGVGGEEAGAGAVESTVPGMTSAEVAQMGKQGYTPEMLARLAAQNAPKPALPARAPITAGGARPRLSTPAAPYTKGPEVMSNILKEPTMNLDSLSNEAAERIPSVNRAELPNIGGKTIMPNLSQTPSLKYGADVETMGDWHPQPSVATPGVAPASAGAGPVEGLKAATPDDAAAGLEKWISGGGTPESYLRAKGALQNQGGGVDPNFNQGVGDPLQAGSHPYGKNTVGAAEAPKWLPQTVDEAKGLSLQEQEAWASYKAANPGVTDSMLNSWYTSNQLGANPNEGMDINAMADKLTELLRARKP